MSGNPRHLRIYVEFTRFTPAFRPYSPKSCDDKDLARTYIVCRREFGMRLTIGASYLVRFGPPEIPTRCKWSPALYLGQRPYKGAERHIFKMDAGYVYSTIEPARDVRGS